VPARLSLILADRPTGRAPLVALAGAVEGSPVGARVDLALARGVEAVASAARQAAGGGQEVVVAWSFLSPEVAEVREELARARSGMPARVVNLAGGAHATADPAGTLALGFDLVARGEGERTLVGVLEKLAAGGDPRGVAGLAWGSRAGLATSGRPDPVRLDDHPGFSRRLAKALWLEVTRGCAWGCRFCQTPFLHRRRFRHRSVASARAFARFARSLGHRDLRLLTPSALSYGAEGGEVRLEAVEELLAALREELGGDGRLFLGSFPSELRPEHVSPAALRLLRRFVDNRELLLGAQSGSERLLAEMKRGHGTSEVVRAVRLASAAGFRVAVDFIVGLPGETAEDLAATRRLMAELAQRGARIHAHAFLPLPGTPLRDRAPGQVDPATRALLDRLGSRGRAYGSWRRQLELGEALSRLRGEGPRPGGSGGG